VLLAIPDGSVRRPVATLLATHGYSVESVDTMPSAHEAIAQAPPEALVLACPALDGDPAPLARALRRRRPDVAILLITCAARRELPPDEAALAPLIDERLDRPLEPGRLLQALAAALWRHRHAAQVPSPRPSEPGGIAVSRAAPWPTATGGPASTLVRASLIVLVGYGLIAATYLLLHVESDYSVVREQTSVTSDLWLQRTPVRTRSGARLEVFYLSPAEVALRTGEPGAGLAATDRATFEIRLSAAQRALTSTPSVPADPLEVADGSIELHLLGRLVAPEEVRAESDGSDRTAPTRVLLASFPRRLIAGASSLRLTLRLGDEQVGAELDRVAPDRVTPDRIRGN